MDQIEYENRMLKRGIKILLRGKYLDEKFDLNDNNVTGIMKALLKPQDSGIEIRTEKKTNKHAYTNTADLIPSRHYRIPNKAEIQSQTFKDIGIQIESEYPDVKVRTGNMFAVETAESSTHQVVSTQPDDLVVLYQVETDSNISMIFNSTATQTISDDLEFQLAYYKHVNQELDQLLIASHDSVDQSSYQLLLQRYNHSLYVIEQQQIELLQFRRSSTTEPSQPTSPTGAWI